MAALVYLSVHLPRRPLQRARNSGNVPYRFALKHTTPHTAAKIVHDHAALQGRRGGHKFRLRGICTCKLMSHFNGVWTLGWNSICIQETRLYTLDGTAHSRWPMDAQIYTLPLSFNGRIFLPVELVFTCELYTGSFFFSWHTHTCVLSNIGDSEKINFHHTVLILSFCHFFLIRT